MNLPVIIDPFSTFGDEIAGETPNQIALNLAEGTRISLSWHRKPVRECPDLRAAFHGLKASLSPEAKLALQWVAKVYARFTPKLKEAA